MQKTGKMIIAIGLGLVITLGLTTIPASAAAKTRVLSTTRITRTAYHGRQGNIYSSAKLTKVRYHLNKYQHTTWYATKRATVKKHGKKASLTYITAGAKKGWIYSKYLAIGKAPVNKAKIMANDISSVKRICLTASSRMQQEMSYADSYYGIGSGIANAASYYELWLSVPEKQADRDALVNIYQLLKNRLPMTATQKVNMNVMAAAVENTSATDDGEDTSSQQYATLANSLSDLLEDM